MEDKLNKLLIKLYEKQDKNNGWLSDQEEGMKYILNIILDKDEDTLNELMEDYDV